MGRTFFEGSATHCRTEAGYTVLKSVVTREKGDLMPSYFLAETLKYLYLLFAPDETAGPGEGGLQHRGASAAADLVIPRTTGHRSRAGPRGIGPAARRKLYGQEAKASRSRTGAGVLPAGLK